MTIANWNDREVLNLIELWGKEGIQTVAGRSKEKHVYEKLARDLQKTGCACMTRQPSSAEQR